METSRENDAAMYRLMVKGGEARTIWVQKRSLPIPFWKCRAVKGQGSWDALPHLTSNIDHLRKLAASKGVAVIGDDALAACQDIKRRAAEGSLYSLQNS